MPKQQIKTQTTTANQNDYSYEQQIFQNNQSPQQGEIQPAMLDENDEFEIYDNSPFDQLQENTDNSKPQNQSKLEHSHLNDDKQSSSIDFCISDLRNVKLETQPDTDLQDETQKVASLLKSVYARFDQDTLIQRLYDKCFPKNIRTEIIETASDKNNFDNIKKMNKQAQIFVNHGYGINIARRYAQKGQDTTPNPYNNMICKIIKDTWKGIQKEIEKIRKNIRPLNTEQFNQVKTPLINARQWMAKQYLEIFLSIVAYVNGVRPIKPASKDFEKFYDFLIPKTKGRKPSIGKQQAIKKLKREKSRYDESSEEFKVPKHQQKKIVYGKPSKYNSNRNYDN